MPELPGKCLHSGDLLSSLAQIAYGGLNCRGRESSPISQTPCAWKDYTSSQNHRGYNCILRSYPLRICMHSQLWAQITHCNPCFPCTGCWDHWSKSIECSPIWWFQYDFLLYFIIDHAKWTLHHTSGKVFYIELDGEGRMPVLHFGMTGNIHVLLAQLPFPHFHDSLSSDQGTSASLL